MCKVYTWVDAEANIAVIKYLIILQLAVNMMEWNTLLNIFMTVNPREQDCDKIVTVLSMIYIQIKRFYRCVHQGHLSLTGLM